MFEEFQHMYTKPIYILKYLNLCTNLKSVPYLRHISRLYIYIYIYICFFRNQLNTITNYYFWLQVDKPALQAI